MEADTPKNFILNWLLRLFGCEHSRLSFPISQINGKPVSLDGKSVAAYQCCLDCGKEFAYKGELINPEFKPPIRRY